MKGSLLKGSLVRGMAVLGVLALGLAAFAPAFGAAPVKKQIKKGATKVVKQKIDDFGNPIFIEEGNELLRFGPVKLNIGGSQQVATIGPFTFTAVCDDDPTSGNELRGRVRITTSEDNTAFDAEAGGDSDFDVAENGDAGDEENWESLSIPLAADPQAVSGESDVDHAFSPSGTVVFGSASLVLNQGGTPCTIGGWFIVPTA